ncbi:MAG: hypothetical protein LBT40_12150 [Deltaproteobacteria bacterium]|jgi:hypothetical protein|nr:hypothetical protein [Deltaproteobacteria bacterium]
MKLAGTGKYENCKERRKEEENMEGWNEGCEGWKRDWRLRMCCGAGKVAARERKGKKQEGMSREIARVLTEESMKDS